MDFQKRNDILEKARLWVNALGHGTTKKRRAALMKKVRQKKKCGDMEKTDIINDMYATRTNAVE